MSKIQKIHPFRVDEHSDVGRPASQSLDGEIQKTVFLLWDIVTAIFEKAKSRGPVWFVPLTLTLIFAPLLFLIVAFLDAFTDWPSRINRRLTWLWDQLTSGLKSTTAVIKDRWSQP